jgi:hypothetical protein
MPDPDPETNRTDRGKKLTESEGWVKVSRDIDWQDLAEGIPRADSNKLEAADDTQLKSTAAVSLFKEFCLKIINTSSSGVRRRAGGPGAGNFGRE